VAGLGAATPVTKRSAEVPPDTCVVADALLLSVHVDAVLLAVRSGFSRLPVVQAARQRLQ